MTSWQCLILTTRPDHRRIWEQLLRNSGHLVVPADTVQEALDALGTPGLDYLVLDLTNPLLQLPELQHAISPEAPGSPDSLESAERRHIALTLRHTRGNRRQAARLLGIARSTMLSKLRKYGLENVHSKE